MKRPRRARTSAAPAIDIVVRSARWNAQRRAKSILRRAIAAAAAMVSTTGGELAIVLTDDSAIRALNRDWRRKDEATNVLSFPASLHVHPSSSPAGKGRPGGPHLMGDIVIAYETVGREAKTEGKPFGDHLAHLAVHGFLHLVGYDHETEKEAEAMERLEVAVLARLKVPDPYRLRDAKP